MTIGVNLAKGHPLEQGTQGAHDQGGQQQGRPEADDGTERIADIGADHVETGVREIEHAHHGKNQRQSGTEHEQQQAVAQTVERVNDEELHQGDLFGQGPVLRKGTVETVCKTKGPTTGGVIGPLKDSVRPCQPGRFIWQLVGVLATKEGNSLTGARVMPVFSGL